MTTVHVTCADVEKAAAAHPDVVFAKADTEAEQVFAAAARIATIPTLMACQGGNLVFVQPGALPAAALEQVIAEARDLDLDEVAAADPDARKVDA